ncbi:Alpha/Beta hydrolase protein, partial [Massariosphaeria phaeospora]
IVLAVLIRLATAPLRWSSWNGAPVLFKDVFYAAIRTMLEHITIAQARYMYKSTTDTYLDLCAETKAVPNSLHLDGVMCHWIGDEDADFVILFLHGGGYTQPCTIGHMQYFHRLISDLNAPTQPHSSASASASAAVLLPAYTLAPEAIFPTQLSQAATALSHLLTTRPPSRILLTGDSAGGALVLSLLSHILHPHPHPSLAIPRIALAAPLAGVCVYSPWVSFSTAHASFARNAQRDTLVPGMLRKWAAMFLGSARGEMPVKEVTEGDNYSEALLAGMGWWRGVHEKVGDVMVWAGEDEVFVDALREFGERFGEAWRVGGGEPEKATLEVARGEAHIGPIMDVMFKYEGKSRAQVVVEEWWVQRLA